MVKFYCGTCHKEINTSDPTVTYFKIKEHRNGMARGQTIMCLDCMHSYVESKFKKEEVYEI